MVNQWLVDKDEERLKKAAIKKATRKATAHKHHMRWRYGLTSEDVAKKKEEQNNSCFICKNESDKLYVDHNHVTGEIRKMLCPRCNTFVGYVETSPEVLIEVLKYINGKVGQAVPTTSGDGSAVVQGPLNQSGGSYNGLPKPGSVIRI